MNFSDSVAVTAIAVTMLTAFATGLFFLRAEIQKYKERLARREMFYARIIDDPATGVLQKSIARQRLAELRIAEGLKPLVVRPETPQGDVAEEKLDGALASLSNVGREVLGLTAEGTRRFFFSLIESASRGLGVLVAVLTVFSVVTLVSDGPKFLAAILSFLSNLLG